jgi:hypothetical protein
MRQTRNSRAPKLFVRHEAAHLGVRNLGCFIDQLLGVAIHWVTIISRRSSDPGRSRIDKGCRFWGALGK